MDAVQKSVEIFERLRANQYIITIEDGTVLTLRFSRENYHHLAGFQHLTDLEHISRPRSVQQFYRDACKGRITEAQVKKSEHFAEIQERITFFGKLEEILQVSNQKIIVEFHRHRSDSLIQAKYHLFQREGNPLLEKVIYYSLFLDGRTNEKYYPVTYIVEHSSKYVRQQKLLSCTIACLPVNKKSSSKDTYAVKQPAIP